MPLNFLVPRRKAETPTLMLDFTESLDSRIIFARADPGTYYDSAGIMQTAAADVARIKAHTYDGVNWVNRGLLIEEARTNIALQSETVAAPWASFGSLEIFTNNSVAPDGTTTMDRISDDEFNAFVALQQDITIATTNLPYTYSVFVQKVTQDSFPEFQLIMTGGTTVTGTFQLDTQTGDTVIRLDQGGGGASVTVEELTNHWRISMTITNVGGNTNLQVGILPGATKTFGVVEASNLGGINVWGHQVEQGSAATSYIKTTTASVARAADDVSMTDVSWFNQSEGTFYTRVTPYRAAPASDGMLLHINDGTSTDRICFINSSAGSARLRFISKNSNGDDGVVSMSNVLADNTEVQIIGAYSNNDMIMAVDSVLGIQDTTAAFPTTDALTVFNIGEDHNGGNIYNGHIERIVYWNKRIPDGRLQDMTA